MKDSLASDDNNQVIAGDEQTFLEMESIENQIQKKKIKDAIITMVGTCLQKLQIAVVSGMGYITVYLVYFLHSENNDESITKENTLTISSILGFSMFSTIWIGGVLRNYVGIRYIMLGCNICLILAVLGLIFFRSLFAYQIMFLLIGIGIGVPQTITNVNIIQYIPEKKGLISGILNISWTLGCSFFNFLGLQVVNPEDKDVQFAEEDKQEKRITEGATFYDDDKQEHYKVLTYLYVILGCFVVFSVLSIILTLPYNKEKYEKNEDIKDKEENSNNAINNENSTNESINSKKSSNIDDENEIRFIDILKSWRFYSCLIYCSFKNIHGNLIGSSFQIFALHSGRRGQLQVESEYHQLHFHRMLVSFFLL